MFICERLIAAGSQLLVGKLQATYFNAATRAISYDFDKASNGAVFTIRKELKRIDPGDRIIVEIADDDEDRTDQRDTLPFEVVLNNGEAVKLLATETEANTGIFAKEVDTSAMKEAGKIQVKAGDLITLRYLDTHNTFPGHSVSREERVYVARRPWCESWKRARASSQGQQVASANPRAAEEGEGATSRQRRV